MAEYYVYMVAYHQMLELLIKFVLYKDVKKFHMKVPSVVRILFYIFEHFNISNETFLIY